ncbi:MAG: tetratricopeptide repeat protein [Deltaproteobacteria bacterium]|nr:tetratricopeptide repeat protein [Deltaproteobacteria bacterium]
MTAPKQVVLRQETIKLGFGSTARTTVIENYYEVDETEEQGRVALRLLNINDQPFGAPEMITRERLEEEYVACPDYFRNKKSPQEAAIEKHVFNGEAHFEKKEFHSAETEFNKALSLNQKDLRANLGKGKTLFARGDKEEAKKVFACLAQMEDLYEKDNKHIFNEFGIELRKRKLLEEAIANYSKAIEIDPEDAVIFYNLGRAYFEKGEADQAAVHLKKALSLKSDFGEAREFIASLEKSGIKTAEEGRAE